MKTLLKTVTTY